MHAPTLRLELVPLGRSLDVPTGTPLQDVLFPLGIEFPCGGRGRCRGCRIRVLEGHLPVTPEDERALTPAERAAGWRLACRASAQGDLRLELAQWETPVLADETPFEFPPQPGLGAAIDVGTTTLVVQLVDLMTGSVRGVATALNPQARHGADLMSRVEFALQPAGAPTLRDLVRSEIGRLLSSLIAESSTGETVRRVVLTGNTVMHHLFAGLSVEPLSQHPFETPHDGLQEFATADLDWPVPGDPPVFFLPCLGGFVGSDILAGIAATRLHETDQLTGLVDLGTNGEIVVGNRNGLLCASTAAGPAFEGARIAHGMRAASGAIAGVTATGGTLEFRVLGNGRPRGLCGSGLVDAVAVGLDLGTIQPSGRLGQGREWMLADPVSLTQADIRQLQLAKAAVTAGLRILLERSNASPTDLACLHLAGAFGNYISRSSARRIGLIPLPPERVRPAGNTSLLGAKLALFAPRSALDYSDLRQRIRHVSLHLDPRFHEIYVQEMTFPGQA
ncbi:MAG TPA: ASKHA domain-containing protein [Verrucomicrobiota bacterium]|nr:ASKHA domain-containing protein [Verrucomicrobiota bacterium]HNU51198.1 ASKHA domain-containing protein [Verrucomicrobiota bacterium]